MSYIRNILSEETTNDHVIRRYEVEYPDWRAICAGCNPRFAKLVTLELWMSHAAAHRFRDYPYLLAAAIWDCGNDCDCGWAFDPDTRNVETVHGLIRDRVLLYTLKDEDRWGAGPVPIAVELWNEDHPLWDDPYWWRKNEVIYEWEPLSDAEIAEIFGPHAVPEEFR